MLETIGISLIATMISFLFEENILRQNHSVEIQGAPYWYEKKVDDKKISVSTYVDGEFESIDLSKVKLAKKMTSNIQKAYKQSIKKEFNKLHTQKEKVFVTKLLDDENLSDFVSEKMVVQNIKYVKDVQRTFIRGYIDVELLKQYEEKRVLQIKKKVLDHQFDDMMEELNKEAA